MQEAANPSFRYSSTQQVAAWSRRWAWETSGSSRVSFPFIWCYICLLQQRRLIVEELSDRCHLSSSTPCIRTTEQGSNCQMNTARCWIHGHCVAQAVAGKDRTLVAACGREEGRVG
ncbi:hypothetical protein EJB05_26374, partial [Eragrostis curvula]